MPRRNDIQKIFVIGVGLILIMLSSYSASPLRAQVDCVSPRRVYAIRMKGIVVDPIGAPIPNAKVSIESNGSIVAKTAADDQGRFQLKGGRGVYTLRAEYPDQQNVFDKLSVELHSGTTLRTFLNQGEIRLILGIRYSFCTWATTSRNDFENEIRSNNARLKESKQNNATQK